MPVVLPAPAAPAGKPERPDLPAIEREVLRRWQDGQVPERALRQAAGGPRWTCYAAPRPAAGMPGVHHLPALVLADALARFQSMRGRHVPRRAVWDCHGLAVEVAVERELGLAGRAGIEAYGVAAFAARCRESALRHATAITRMAARAGCWEDPAGTAATMDADYVESVWWSLREAFRRGLLVRDIRVSPYCPRCETPLSGRELAQPGVWREVSDPSVILRLRLLKAPAATPSGAVPDLMGADLVGADLLAWTTAPWTLVAAAAVAADPDRTYAVARRSGHGDRVVVADDMAARVLGEGWHITGRLRGAGLAGARYEPPLPLIDLPGAHRVITASFVPAGEGTGLVPVAPAFGPDDLAAAREHGLAAVSPVQPDGTFAPDIPMVGGMPARAASPRLISDLADRGLVLAAGRREHRRPHCWRCGTALLPLAQPAWLIPDRALGDRQPAARQPPPAGAGSQAREWRGLAGGTGDWVVSRTRYWGTPLPLWTCPAGHVTCVGSLAELSARAGRDVTGLDPHRPQVDAVTLPCPDCGVTARRVPEVIDSWYDAGALPFARSGFPHRGEQEVAASYPAQLACADADQAGTWLPALLTVSTLALGRPPFESTACPGPVADARGQAMDRGRGNVQDPLALLDWCGADAVRWFLAAAGPAGAAREVSADALDEIVRTVLLPYWESVSLAVRHLGPADGGASPATGRPALDRWLLSEAAILTGEVTRALEEFRTAAAGSRIAAFIDGLARWYVPLSRQRLRDGPATPDGASAVSALRTATATLTRLMAPLTPFLTDYAWGMLGGALDSVHLAAWPATDASAIDRGLGAQMALARRLADLGQAARAGAALGSRQRLRRALVSAAGLANLPDEVREHVRAGLNVGVLESLAPDARMPGQGWAVAAEGDETVALEVPGGPGAAGGGPGAGGRGSGDAG